MAEVYNTLEFKDTEILVLQNGLNNCMFANIIPKLKTEFFTTVSRQTIYKILERHIVKYNESPSFTILQQEIVNSGLDEHLIIEVAKDLRQIQNGFETNLEWLKDETEKWGSYRSGVLAISESRDIINGLGDRPKSSILEVLELALAFSLEDRIGHSYFDDVEAQYEFYNDPKYRYPCDIEEVNSITQGGVTSKTLNMFFAGINVGKTTWLINMASAYLMRGYNVLYITAEMEENLIRERMDVKMLKCPSDNLRKLSKSEYLEKIRVLHDGTKGQLFVKNYAPSTASAVDIKQVVLDYKIKYNITIDMLCVDYLGIIKSARLPPSAMSDSNLYGKSVAEELRSLAKEMDFPVWSAGQLNRAGQDGVEEVGMKHIADSIGIMATCDLALVGMQPPQLMAENLMKVHNLKNRYVNRTGIKDFVLGVDNEHQNIYSTSKSMDYNTPKDMLKLNQLSTAQNEYMKDKPVNDTLPTLGVDLNNLAGNNTGMVFAPVEEEELDIDLDLLKSLMK